MTQPLTPTQADRAVAERFNCDLGTRLTGTQLNNLAGLLARHAQAARLEGARAMQEAAASKIDRTFIWRPETPDRVATAIRDLDPLSIAEKGV